MSGVVDPWPASSAAAALAKLLLDRGQVVADLSAVRLLWAPALQVFPSTLAALGGWPSARLVLLDPDRELTEAIRAVRIDRVVPLARGWPDAHALIAHPNIGMIVSHYSGMTDGVVLALERVGRLGDVKVFDSGGTKEAAQYVKDGSIVSTTAIASREAAACPLAMLSAAHEGQSVPRVVLNWCGESPEGNAVHSIKFIDSSNVDEYVPQY